MTRAIIFTTETNCNLLASRLEEIGDYIKVYDGESLIGVFDVGVVHAAYISSKKEVKGNAD